MHDGYHATEVGSSNRESIRPENGPQLENSSGMSWVVDELMILLDPFALSGGPRYPAGTRVSKLA